MNSSHFINMFYEKYQNKLKIEKQNLTRTWLHSAGLPQEVSNLEILQIRNSSLFIEVEEAHKEIYDNLKYHKKKGGPKDLEDLELILRFHKKFIIIYFYCVFLKVSISN